MKESHHNKHHGTAQNSGGRRGVLPREMWKKGGERETICEGGPIPSVEGRKSQFLRRRESVLKKTSDVSEK